MRRFALVALLVTGAAPALGAQAAMVVPEKPLDSERARLRDTVYVMRDTLAAVNASIARLQRDFRTASTPVLVSRARTLTADCAAARRRIPATRSAIAAAPIKSKLVLDQQKRTTTELARLETELDRCVTEFGRLSTPAKGEEVRGYGNRKAAPIQTQIRRYDEAVTGFFSALEIPHRPLGARRNPLAG
jgi:septal ring factor EnvC (AmiA/AmiB activator)